MSTDNSRKDEDTSTEEVVDEEGTSYDEAAKLGQDLAEANSAAEQEAQEKLEDAEPTQLPAEPVKGVRTEDKSSDRKK